MAEGNRVLGEVEVKDIVKTGIKERFAGLRAMAIKTVMITGDNKLTAAAIAAEAGVDAFLAEAAPKDKLALIRQCQADGRLVAMTGTRHSLKPPVCSAWRPQRDRVLGVLKLAEELGGATAVLTAAGIAQKVAAQAQRLNCATLVRGRSEPPARWRRLWPKPLLWREIARHTPAMDLSRWASPIAGGGYDAGRSAPEAATPPGTRRARIALGGRATSRPRRPAWS